MEAKAVYWPMAFVCPHGRSSGACLARLRAEWRNTLRYSALRAAQTPQNSARLAAHAQFIILEDALLYSSFVSLSRIFFILLAICLLVLLPEFFDGDV
jgi:hypothetical protein